MDENQPMSPDEIEAWREQRARDTARRAMLRAWKRLAIWVGGALIALNALGDIWRGLFGPPGR